VVRNPIFSALILAAIGLAMMVPNPISIVGVFVLILAIELQVRFVEEPHLRQLHGDDYAVYASRVGRFVPGIGRL
jgi:protein-S-isoprenylcysteine O-methyltransferase Ste14